MAILSLNNLIMGTDVTVSQDLNFKYLLPEIPASNCYWNDCTQFRYRSICESVREDDSEMSTWRLTKVRH